MYSNCYCTKDLSYQSRGSNFTPILIPISNLIEFIKIVSAIKASPIKVKICQLMARSAYELCFCDWADWEGFFWPIIQCTNAQRRRGRDGSIPPRGAKPRVEELKNFPRVTKGTSQFRHEWKNIPMSGDILPWVVELGCALSDEWGIWPVPSSPPLSITIPI